MATRQTSKISAQGTPAKRMPVTIELVTKLCLTQAQADRIAETFGLNPVDFDSVRDETQAQIQLSSQIFEGFLNEKAMAIHLQRIVGAYVASAHGAAAFYGEKVSGARNLTARLANDDRDEDRGGPVGFEDRASRARRFAAETGLQAFALLAAAQGAVGAFEHITGDAWQPYRGPVDAPATVSRRSAAAEMDAFAV
jgi:hypothetical protein